MDDTDNFMSTEFNDQEFEESPAGFDLEQVRPFLQRISPLIESGFGEVQINQVCQLIERMEIDATEELEFSIRLGGKATSMRVSVFMDDIESPDICFFSPPALSARIDAEIESFFEELGI